MLKAKSDALVLLKADPSRLGKIIRIQRNGKVALVQFEKHSRPTLHNVDGLIVVSSSPQLSLRHSSR